MQKNIFERTFSENLTGLVLYELRNIRAQLVVLAEELTKNNDKDGTRRLRRASTSGKCDSIVISGSKF